MRILTLAFGLFLVGAIAHAKPDAPSFDTIPHLSPKLKNGTVAWAWPWELKAGQSGTGLIEDERKIKEYEALLPEGDKAFPKKLYKFLYREGVISPVILGPVPSWDSRRGKQQWLGWVTDRTHGSASESMEIKYRLGKRGLLEPIYENDDEKNGRPLNFILVRKVDDWTSMQMNAFKAAMIKDDHVYLRDFRLAMSGKTIIVPIRIEDLPETPFDTVDNPFRGIIGEAQHNGFIKRVGTDFFQFKLAEMLVLYDVVGWKDIAKDPVGAEKDAAKFFKSHPTYLYRDPAKYCQFILDLKK
jgi:Putative ParB-like nuclease